MGALEGERLALSLCYSNIALTKTLLFFSKSLAKLPVGEVFEPSDIRLELPDVYPCVGC